MPVNYILVGLGTSAARVGATKSDGDINLAAWRPPPLVDAFAEVSRGMDVKHHAGDLQPLRDGLEIVSRRRDLTSKASIHNSRVDRRITAARTERERFHEIL